MATSQEQPPNLPPLTTSNISAPKYDDLMVSPPPAYCPPEGMAGPPFAFLRTASFPVQYGAYDAYTTHQTNPSTTETLTPEAQALVDQYTVYFTQLFTTWIEWAVLFYKYGIPVIRWSSFFFIRGLGGWRENFLLGVWFLVWMVPGLYFGIVSKNLQDVPKFEGDQEPWAKILIAATFWGTWTGILALKFGLLAWITGKDAWWMWGLWGMWASIFGW